MRQTVILAMLLLIGSSVLSQPSNANPKLTQQNYLDKSKNQKLAGQILLTGGAGLMLTGLIIPRGELIEPCYGGWFCSKEHENDGIKSGFIVAGTITMLSSIPLFIISGKTKTKATFVSFINQNTVRMDNQNLVYTSVPALRMKVEF